MGKMSESWAEDRADRLEFEVSDLKFENHMLLFENKVLKKTIEDTRNILSTYDNTRENNIEYLKYIGCAITQAELIA